VARKGRSGKTDTVAAAVVDNGRQQESQGRPLVTVGIGASSVELASLERFFEQMLAVPGAAYVIIFQHRDALDEPQFVSRLTAVSGRAVNKITDGMSIKPDNIYYLPSATMVTMADRVFQIRPVEEPAGERGTIDSFLVSLAEQERKQAIGMVMAGVGTDGTLGVIAIKEQGGFTLAERAGAAIDFTLPSAQPKTAAAVADAVLVPEELATRIKSQIRIIQRLASAENFDDLVAQATPQLNRIAAVLRNRTGHDFHGYKPNTFLRRVQRRMQVTQTDTLDAYLEFLRTDSDEANGLFNDLLIGVTHFFRDTNEFEYLEKDVIPRLFEGKEAGDQIRVWVLGCATGEEAYSIAMLLREHMAGIDVVPHIQIFATDIDTRSLAQARVGRYAASAVKDVTPERLAR
jgi:two-component system, chemotaxis family, CheB/CheR fusion protein